MTKRSEIAVTSFDPSEMKRSLIEYLKTKEGFEDFDYEGSAINTIIDLLVRNSAYASFQANMVANESFLDSAQIRSNVSSHAQKLSYVPRSRTAARAIVDIKVRPVDTTNITEHTITADAGTSFVSSDGEKTYSFCLPNSISLIYSIAEQAYVATDVMIYQGNVIEINHQYDGEKEIIYSKRIDTSTLTIYVDDGVNRSQFIRAEQLGDLDSTKNVYFLRENTLGYYEFEFGKDVVGVEPSLNSEIIYRYVETEREHANGADSFVAASSIDGYTNIEIEVKSRAAGGYDRDSIEDMRFLAPKLYRAQNRAVISSDYESIIKQRFPFIRDVRVWGGEDNDPPRYGVAIISLSTEDGYYLTSALEEEIKRAIKEKSVGSVTPEIVRAVVFELHLTVSYRMKIEYETGRDYIETEQFIQDSVMGYSKNNLMKFSTYYNEYELMNVLNNNSKIETVVIDKEVSVNLPVTRNLHETYEINYANKIEPKSFRLADFECTDCPDETVYDDGDGSIYHDHYRNGILRRVKVGEIDYDTGNVHFSLTFIQNQSFVRAYAIPQDNNYKTTMNGIVRIDTVKTKRMS